MIILIQKSLKFINPFQFRSNSYFLRFKKAPAGMPPVVAHEILTPGEYISRVWEIFVFDLMRVANWPQVSILCGLRDPSTKYIHVVEDHAIPHTKDLFMHPIFLNSDQNIYPSRSIYRKFWKLTHLWKNKMKVSSTTEYAIFRNHRVRNLQESPSTQYTYTYIYTYIYIHIYNIHIYINIYIYIYIL